MTRIARLGAGLACAFALLMVGCTTATQPPTTASPCSAPDQDPVPNVTPDPLAKVVASAVTLSGDGRSLAAGCADDTCVWDTNSGRLTTRLGGGSRPSWSPTANRIALGSAT
jgi:hypothetical protein